MQLEGKVNPWNWHLTDFLSYVTCSDNEEANKLEIALKDTGFFCGGTAGNTHNPDSIYAYIYKRTSYTRDVVEDDDNREKKYIQKL